MKCVPAGYMEVRMILRLFVTSSMLQEMRMTRA